MPTTTSERITCEAPTTLMARPATYDSPWKRWVSKSNKRRTLSTGRTGVYLAWELDARQTQSTYKFNCEFDTLHLSYLRSFENLEHTQQVTHVLALSYYTTRIRRAWFGAKSSVCCNIICMLLSVQYWRWKSSSITSQSDCSIAIFMINSILCKQIIWKPIQ